MFAYVEDGKLVKICQTPEDPEIGDSFKDASLSTLRSFGWYPVIIQKAEIGEEQTRSDDIIYIDGDCVRVIQTVRDLSDEEQFFRAKTKIYDLIERIEHEQSDRSERELLLLVCEHLDLTDSHAYERLKQIDTRIAEKRELLGG